MLRFEWDEAKAKSNLQKHGVTFEDAMLVFADPFALVQQDCTEDGELRWQTLGFSWRYRSPARCPHRSQRRRGRNNPHRLGSKSSSQGAQTL
jgi:hypothetical protein